MTNKHLHTEADKSTELRIVIAGGGTGGHIFPAVAIANAIRAQLPQARILFIGALGKMEMERIPEAGYDIEGLDITGFNRSSLLKNAALPFKMLKSYWKVREIFKSFKPQAAIGVGGYSTYPVLRYAQSKKIPTFIHEANSLGGKSNILLAKRAVKVFAGTTGMEKYFPQEKIVVTGNPIRKELTVPVAKAESLRHFGLKEGMKTVFVFGGSLGAQSINEVIKENIGVFGKNKLQLIWQTGKEFAKEAAAIEEEHSNIWTNAFVADMRKAYSAADVVVARAGAMTVAELCAVRKATIFVPYPYAAEDHQTVNAMMVVREGGAQLVRDAEVKSKLMPALLELIGDEEKTQEMEKNMGKLAREEVDILIADEILRELGAKND